MHTPIGPKTSDAPIEKYFFADLLFNFDEIYLKLKKKHRK